MNNSAPKGSMVTTIKLYIFPALVTVISMLIWRDISELRSDVKALLAQSNIDKTRIDNLINDVKTLDKLKIELRRIEKLGGFNAIVPSEGVVFVYKGQTFKLTGAFAPVNQILGVLKYSR
jgi:hypothetical protein